MSSHRVHKGERNWGRPPACFGTHTIELLGPEREVQRDDVRTLKNPLLSQLAQLTSRRETCLRLTACTSAEEAGEAVARIAGCGRRSISHALEHKQHRVLVLTVGHDVIDLPAGLSVVVQLL